jgi:hypothetical protein
VLQYYTASKQASKLIITAFVGRQATIVKILNNWSVLAIIHSNQLPSTLGSELLTRFGRLIPNEDITWVGSIQQSMLYLVSFEPLTSAGWMPTEVPLAWCPTDQCPTDQCHTELHTFPIDDLSFLLWLIFGCQ